MYFSNAAFISAIGATADMTINAIDAQISGYREGDYTCANGSKAIVAALDDGLFIDAMLDVDIDAHFTPTLVRRLKLLAFAIEDLKQQVALSAPVPLIWLDEEAERNRDTSTLLPNSPIAQLLAELDAPVNQEPIYSISAGRATGIGGLKMAHQLMHEQGCDYVLMGSAESPLSDDWLAALDENGRLKAEGILDGFAPGEAAGFILLARTAELSRACQREQQPSSPDVYIYPPGVAQSPSHWGNTVAHKGEALHQAIVTAFEHCHQHAAEDNSQAPPQTPRCDAIVASLNGEHFWMKEHSVAVSRLSDELGDATLYHPFEYTGDLGAFSGILLLTQAAQLIKNDVHHTVLAYSMSDTPWRAAAVLEGQDGHSTAQAPTQNVK